MKTFKRIMSILLISCLLFCSAPATSAAGSDNAPTATSETGDAANIPSLTGLIDDVIGAFFSSLADLVDSYTRLIIALLKSVKLPDLSDPVVPDVPNVPDTPAEPDTPDVPDTPDEPDTPAEPDTPDVPDTPAEPDTPDVPDTPDTPDTSDVPVGNDVAKIVEYYNTAANNTKAYNGTFKLDMVQGVTTAITQTSLPNVAVSIANSLLPNDYPTKKTFTVTNGQGTGRNETTGTNETAPIADILPVVGADEMSRLSADGVKSAACVETADGYKVTIVLKPETVHSLDDAPLHHSSCVNVLDITADDLKPFTAKTMDIKYMGTTIIATINENNLLTEFDVNNPVDASGEIEWTIITASVVIDAKWRQNVKFTY